MSDDIKLPELGEMTLHMWQDCLVHYNKELTKRAHRIEKLEAALQEFIDPCIEHCFDTCQSECDPMKDCPCFKARKALEGKDD